LAKHKVKFCEESHCKFLSGWSMKLLAGEADCSQPFFAPRRGFFVGSIDTNSCEKLVWQ
jgi:hypothetical protein